MLITTEISLKMFER